MRAVASGSIRKPGLSRAQAEEFVIGRSTKNLPEKASGAKRRRPLPAKKMQRPPKK